MESSKYDKLIKSLADLDVALVDANNEYRSTYDIMADIAEKWDSLTSMEQAALAETIAGTRQQAAFFSIISNFQEASGAMDAMANSAGELEKAYDVYLGSTTAHVNQFKAAFEELGANTFNSKTLANIVDLGTAFTGYVNALVKAKALLPTIGFASILLPQIIKTTTATIASQKQVAKLSAELIKNRAINDQLSTSIAALTAQQLQKVEADVLEAYNLGKLTASEYNQLSVTIQQTMANVELAESNNILATSYNAIKSAIPGWGWVLISITLVTGVMGKLAQSAQEAKQAFIDSSNAIGDELSTLNNYKASVEEIINSTETETEKLEKLNEIREKLNNTYDSNLERMNNEREAAESLNKELDGEIERRRKLYLIENEDEYKKAAARSRDFTSESYHFWEGRYRDYRNPFGGINETIERFGPEVGAPKGLSDAFLNLFPTDSQGRLTIGQNVKNEIELLNAYQEVLLKIDKIRTDRNKLGQDLSVQEINLYNRIKTYYDEIKNDMSENGYSYDSIMEYTGRMAEDIVATTERGSRSVEEWRNELISLANGDEYVIEKINELINATSEVNDIIEDSVDVLGEAYKEIERIQDMLDALDESMQTAKDIFEDLAKTIKSNNDADKFFTSTEIIDLLDKYPELSNAILETSYGYKIETEALEQLRQAKLAEQKDALAAQITETESAIESVQRRIDAYTAEVRGVKSLAEAKVELAKIDAAVAKINSINSATPFVTGLENTQKSLEARRKALAGWVGTAEELDKLNESLKKSKMQYTVLGKVFDDVEDKSKDVSKALSDQKNKLKDLADEYKDAQDKINDLVKLTMDMIKKELNLEKDSIKERIDNFKKLIDKKKELLDIEKDCTIRYCPLYLERIQCIPLNCWDPPRGLYATA